MAFVMALFLFYTVATVYAGTNTITANPGIINKGATTQITVTTDFEAHGKLKVTYKPTSTSWFATVDINIPSGGGSQHWIFPTDFETGANTDNVGDYDVTATITSIKSATFRAEFFVVPDLPFGTLMAVVACFGAVIGYKKLKQ
jgi:hypothetical protein